MNQSAEHARDELRRHAGKLHLTTSFLIRHERLRSALETQTSALRWDKKLFDVLRSQPHNSGLSRAVEPMFDDIADRKRGLFVDDFLIQSGSPHPRRDHRPALSDSIDIGVPSRIAWSTEGSDLCAEFDRPARFEGVHCRAFWVAHSNLSLSYHLSFEIPYRHTAADYYALSVLQKVLFPTELVPTTQELDAGSVITTSQYDPRRVERSLSGYIRHRFTIDVADLFKRILTTSSSAPAKAVEGTGLAHALLDGDTPGGPVANWQPVCVSVLEDAYFFHLLRPDHRDRPAGLDAVEPTGADDGFLVYDQCVLDRCDADDLARYFLSGYFQNVIDFLRQDVAEVLDGTEPVYPLPDTEDDPGSLTLYVSPTAVYEVVDRSRSLSAGRGWIGTCPYLFLVHLMTLHNEDLVRRYEEQVRGLIEHLERVDLLGVRVPGRGRPSAHSDETFNRFREFRLTTFEEVHRHRYFNILRYSTESAFYEAIEAGRGIHQREQYWAAVVRDVERMETAVDDLRTARQQRADSLRNKLLGAVAVIGILQVAFEGLNYSFEGNPGKIAWAIGLFLGAALLAAAVALLPGRRRK
ncbi:hypothetical protein [Amycolatopsis sp. NPDC049159]|uniref:hypothetical protein n=1 Tax=Amycolatopsis sp. NPDC049159 TaxID=3157210 RepID=UPI0033F01B7A